MHRTSTTEKQMTQHSSEVPSNELSTKSQIYSDPPSTDAKRKSGQKLRNRLNETFACDKTDYKEFEEISHDQQAVSCFEKGLRCEDEGLIREALKMYGQCVALTSARNDMETAKYYYYFASALEKTGYYDRALRNYELALGLYAIYKSEESYEVTVCRDAIGNVLLEIGRYKQALENFIGSINVKIQISEGVDSLANSFSNISRAHFYLGEYEQALNNAFKALHLRHEHFGEYHIQVASSYNDIGILLTKQGKYKEAKKYHQQALAIQKGYLPENHPDIAISILNIGIALAGQELYSFAIDEFLKSLKISSANQDDLQIAKCKKYLGLVHHELGFYEEAKSYFIEALDVWMTNPEEMRLEIAQIYNSMGINLVYLEDQVDQSNLFNQALDIYREAYEYDHIDSAACYYNYAAFYQKNEKFDLAAEQYKKCLKIMLKYLPKEHCSIGKVYYNLGLVYFELKSSDQALFYYHKALKVYTENYADSHPKFAEIYMKISEAYESQKGYQKAIKTLKKAKEVRTQLFGTSSPGVKQINDIISNLIKKQNQLNTLNDDKENEPLGLNFKSEASEASECV